MTWIMALSISGVLVGISLAVSYFVFSKSDDWENTGFVFFPCMVVSIIAFFVMFGQVISDQNTHENRLNADKIRACKIDHLDEFTEGNYSPLDVKFILEEIC